MSVFCTEQNHFKEANFQNQLGRKVNPEWYNIGHTTGTESQANKKEYSEKLHHKRQLNPWSSNWIAITNDD